MRDYSTDYTYGYTTGYLGMWNAPALRMKVRVTRHTLRLAESYKAYAEAGIERATRHTLRLASNKQYGVEVSKKEKWTRGNDSLFIVVAPVCFYSYPHGPLLYLLLVT